MTLPVALVRSRPHGMFANLPFIKSIEENVLAAKDYYRRVRNLPTPTFLPEIDKPNRRYNKRLRDEYNSTIEMYDRLIKHADITALTIMSQPGYKLEDYREFKQNKEKFTHSILVRGIAAGPVIDYVKNQGLDYYFMETGYFGNYKCKGNGTARKFWHRIVKNAMQHEQILDVPDDRWRKLLNYDSRLAWNGWKKGGRSILVVAPSDKPCGYYGIDKGQWIRSTVDTLKQYTDRPIVVREKGDRTERTSSNIIYDAFDQDVFAIVTYNSIAAIEAVAYGIPAFALAPNAAKPVSLNDLSKIETPYYPDVEFVYRWLSSLAYGQYHLEEMLLGEAWKIVQENEQRPTISY